MDSSEFIAAFKVKQTLTRYQVLSVITRFNLLLTLLSVHHRQEAPSGLAKSVLIMQSRRESTVSTRQSAL